MSGAEPTDRSPYRGYRFPPEIIGYAVWLYFRFHLSFRDVQDLLAERGIVVSYEAIRQWCIKFGPTSCRAAKPRASPDQRCSERARTPLAAHCKNNTLS